MSGKWGRNFLGKLTTKNRTRENLKKMARICAYLILVVVFAAGFLFSMLVFNDLTESAKIFHLDRITFEGLNRADASHLEQLINDVISENVLAASLFQVRSILESENWIKSAVVRRRLPDKIEVYIEERIPEAVAVIEGELKVVDREGIALASFGPKFEFLDRPIIKGMISAAVEGARIWNSRRMKLYFDILHELDRGEKNYSKTISEVDLSETNQVRVIPTSEPVPVLLGERDYLQRYETFVSRMDLVREVKSRHGKIEWIDVTFTNRIILHTPRGQGQSEIDIRGSD